MNQHQTTLMKKWLDALKSGKFQQAQKALYNGHGYCCLGVADKVCFGATFHKLDAGDDGFSNNYWVDDKGIEGRLANPRARKLGLLNLLNSQDVHRLSTHFAKDKLPPLAHTNTAREDFLIEMNDRGYTFEQIAEVIELCEWDKNMEKVA